MRTGRIIVLYSKRFDFMVRRFEPNGFRKLKSALLADVVCAFWPKIGEIIDSFKVLFTYVYHSSFAIIYVFRLAFINVQLRISCPLDVDEGSLYMPDCSSHNIDIVSIGQ